MNNEIHINHITKRYGDVEALRDLSLEIGSGELFGLIGPDGAGKTTLFRILTTLLLADSGTASVCGLDVPGFKKDELQIELKDGYLTVSGSKEVTSKDMPEENQKDATTAEADASKKDAKAEQKTVKYIRQERYSGNVSRSFYVGENLEEKDIHAKFENGTLTLTFPKELEKKAVEEKHFVSIEG